MANFPQLCFDDCYRANKSTKAGAIFGENYRHITGEINGTNGVFGIVNIGWVQASFAPVAARLARMEGLEAHARAADLRTEG